MYPPKKSESEKAVRGLVESLARAGLEVADLVKDPSSGAWVVRLFSAPPANGMTPLRGYSKHYMSACGYKVRVKTSNLRLWVFIEKTL